MEETSFVTLLSIKILLTDKGMREYKHILSVVFDYIALLSSEEGLRTYYDELAEIEHTCFRFQQKSNSTTYVTNVATAMAVKPLQFILNHLPFRDFDFRAIPLASPAHHSQQRHRLPLHQRELPGGVRDGRRARVRRSIWPAPLPPYDCSGDST